MQDDLYDIIELFKYSSKKKDWEGISDALFELTELYKDNFGEIGGDRSDVRDGWDDQF